jgi:hypothetical protein
MSGTIAAVALRSFVETAKFDHLVYKFEIYKVFLGVSGKKVEDFASHTACRLGKWYYEGDGRHCFSQLPGYREIEPAHIEVHQNAVAAIRHYYEGEMDKALEATMAMEKASFKVLEELERMAVSGQNDSALLCTH